jgi:hypothetical protein
MPVLGHVTRGRAAATIAVAAAATLLVGCSDDEVLLDDSLRPAPTPERPTYTDKFTVGSATFTTNLPDGARAFELTAAESRALLGIDEESVYIVSWPGHDLSTISFADFINGVDGDHKTIDKMVKEAVTWYAFPVDCMGFDTAQNRDYTIDSMSPLNGQPLTYSRATDLSEMVGDKPLGEAGIKARTSDVSGEFFVIKLDTKPCGAVAAAVQYARNSPDNTLKDFGYRLFVEGDGTVTTTNP